MVLRKWDELPEFMKCTEVRAYYDVLSKKRFQMFAKRILDFVLASLMLVILAIPMLIVALLIKIDSPGPVFFRQERVTEYGRTFRIHKFRTMVNNAEKIGAGVTAQGDVRITKLGRTLRRFRIDETAQLIDVIAGAMCFVGTRPEIRKYVDHYTNEMYATLLMPAGITSEASIRFKDEDKLLSGAEDVDRVYVEEVLPRKMEWNLKSIREFGFGADLRTMFRTISAVLGKDYTENKKL